MNINSVALVLTGFAFFCIFVPIVWKCILSERLYSIKREVAPWGDYYDLSFIILIGFVLAMGYAIFVDSLSLTGLRVALQQFIKRSGTIALITAPTVIIALCRLRHRPDKTRPSVREDFENYDGEVTDFGLRNYGPGPALYLQVIVEVVDDDSDNGSRNSFESATCLEVHESPIHLEEGEFVSLVQQRQAPWVEKMAEKFGIQPVEGRDGQHNDSIMVDLHYTHVSQSGAREPTDLTLSGTILICWIVMTCLIEMKTLGESNFGES